jgi:hypothetical protein
MAKKQKEQRLRGDAAGIGPYAREREHLVPLGDMRGWNVVDGEADIRSWEVKTLSGKVLGSVRELLIDPEAGEAVMLDVDLAGSSRHAYVPIRAVEIDRTRRVVRADSGDLEEYDGAAPDTRLSQAELARVRQRDVRYADAGQERVVERRPVVEETVVRRREADDRESRL